jgi:hypothetical protein
MSLAKLLSTGKSLVGGATDSSNRYRMGSPGLLPKFGSAVKAVPSEPKAPMSVSAEGECMKSGVAPEQQSPRPAEPRRRKFSIQEIVGSWLRRIQWRRGRKLIKPKAREVLQFQKKPVQAELSLDNVRVVRNDLSDSDLEIVPVRAEPPAAVATAVVTNKITPGDMNTDPEAREQMLAECDAERK